MFHSHGASDTEAGLLLGVSLAVGIVGALTVPAIAARVRDQRALVVAFTACAAVGWLGTLVQSVGYVLAAFIPLAIGALHDATGSWTTPVVLLLALLLPQTVGGLIAGRKGHVGAPATAVDTCP